VTQGYAAHPGTPSAGDHCRDVLDGVRLEPSRAREARSPLETRHTVQRVEQQGEIVGLPLGVVRWWVGWPMVASAGFGGSRLSPEYCRQYRYLILPVRAGQACRTVVASA
jgi:hypothetical protein